MTPSPRPRRRKAPPPQVAGSNRSAPTTGACLTPLASTYVNISAHVDTSQGLRLCTFSLLVALDDLGIANACGAGIATGFAERTTLSQQIPTLIEADLDRLQAAVLALAQTTLRTALVELVFVGDELFDAIV